MRINYILTFVAGALCGALAAFVAVKVDLDSKDEIAEYVPHSESEPEKTPEQQREVRREDMSKYSAVVDEYSDDDSPYVISKDDFDTLGYDIEDLTMYADGVLVRDEDEEIIENPDEHIGLKNLSYADDDILYIRNPSEEIDIRIAFDHNKYEDERLVDDS